MMMPRKILTNSHAAVLLGKAVLGARGAATNGETSAQRHCQ